MNKKEMEKLFEQEPLNDQTVQLESRTIYANYGLDKISDKEKSNITDWLLYELTLRYHKEPLLLKKIIEHARQFNLDNVEQNIDSKKHYEGLSVEINGYVTNTTAKELLEHQQI